MNIAEMQAELHAAKATGIVDLIVASAKAQGIDPAFALAIGSRENDLVNSIGDGGHAVGVMQVDIRFWPAAAAAKADGSWKTHPEVLIGTACRILADNLAWARRADPTFSDAQCLKVAADAYNGGIKTAEQGIRDGDADRYTTGGNYGADVLSRMSLLKQLGY